MTMAAVLSEPGKLGLTAFPLRAVVLGTIAALHVLILYLLSIESHDRFGRLPAAVTEAEIIPPEQRELIPPAFLPVVLTAERHIEIPPLQVTIDMPPEPVSAPRAIDTSDSHKSPLPVAVSPPPAVDLFPVTRPRPISGPSGMNRYPNASIKAKESGTVAMIICVSPQGSVDRVELAHSSGFPRLDKAALSIAAEYRFRPALRGGHPVAACVEYKVIFKVT